MEKIITISGKNYQMKASALTQFLYKNETGRSFITDLQKLSSAHAEANNDVEAMVDAMDDITTILLKISIITLRKIIKILILMWHILLLKKMQADSGL